jgi:hypothetical protein
LSSGAAESDDEEEEEEEEEEVRGVIPVPSIWMPLAVRDSMASSREHMRSRSSPHTLS